MGEPMGGSSDDRVAAVLERTLVAYADRAPVPYDLASRARRVRRRRATGGAMLATGAALAVAAAVVVPTVLLDRTSQVQPQVQPLTTGTGEPVVPVAADGWRWESYRGIELQVPDTWGYGATDGPWCAAGVELEPHVGRPAGATLAIACEGWLPPPELRRPVLWFEPSDLVPADSGDLGDGWTLDVVQLDDRLAHRFALVTDDPAVRERVLASARIVDGDDWAGCPPSSAVSDPAARPTTGALPAAAAVSGAAVCRYQDPVDGAGGTLVESDRLDDAAAAALVDALRVAAPPVPTGADCGFVHGLDDVALLVRLETADGTHDLYVRPADCGRTVDDGTERFPVDARVAPFLAPGSLGS